MHIGLGTRWGVLLALVLLTAPGAAEAGKGPSLSASGQTIGGPAEVRLPGAGDPDTRVAWFQEPIAACASLVSNLDARYQLELDSGAVVSDAAPAGRLVTACRPDVIGLRLECLHPKGCRVTWRIDQLEETLR